MKYRTEPPWEFLLSASRNSLQSYELSRLSHAANLRKEISQLLDSWLEENTAAMLARWLMEHHKRPGETPVDVAAATLDEETVAARKAQGKKARSVSDNFFADSPASWHDFRHRP